MSDQPARGELFVATIAARQHGVVTVAQLRSAGIDKHGVMHRTKTGRLHRVHRGVYAVGHASLSFEGRCMAAALSGGNRSVVSHVSAAAIWGMLHPQRGSIEITVSTRNGRGRRNGIQIHRSPLDSLNATRRNGIPVTRPKRTLRDLHRGKSRHLYLRAVRRALDLRLISDADLRDETERSRSELERRMLALCRRHGLPTPQVNVQLGSFEVDFLWIDYALVVETDGFRFHRDRVAFESDRSRDAELQALGYRVVRFTHRQVDECSAQVVGRLRRVMRL
jgi:very-short-patch-repair endonuclease